LRRYNERRAESEHEHGAAYFSPRPTLQLLSEFERAEDLVEFEQWRASSVERSRVSPVAGGGSRGVDSPDGGSGGGRGLHLSTFRLIISAFCRIGGASEGCLWGV